MGLLLGIDIGTSSSKAIVMDERGNCISTGLSLYDINIPSPNFAEQDAQMLWRSVCSAVSSAVSQDSTIKDNIVAIGVTGQMHGIVSLDVNMNPIRPVIIWADQRSGKQIRELRKTDLDQRVGNLASTGFLYSSLLWIKENEPENYALIHKVLLPKDYIRYRICKEIGTDYSDASGTLLFNIHSNSWDTKELRRQGIPEEIMPQIFHSSEIAGFTRKEFCLCTGLAEGIPVVYGGGDTPMQLAANGIVEKGMLGLNIGTSSQINCISNRPVNSDNRLSLFRHVCDDLWIEAGASLNGGIILKWLKQKVFFNKIDYPEMDVRASKSVPGANGIVFLPFLCGERSPYLNEDAVGILYGLKLSNNENDIIRAAMESVVFSFKDCMEVYKEIQLPMQDYIIASGGGSSSSIWRQIQADILQKVIRVSTDKELAAKGAAISAGVGCGLFSSFQEGCKATAHLSDEVYEPNNALADIYHEKFEIYRSLYKNNKELFSL